MLVEELSGLVLPKARSYGLVLGVDAPRHHECARQFMPRVNGGHGGTTDARASGVHVFD